MAADGEGQAALVIGKLLGYVDDMRQRPNNGLLANNKGQYLHLVGHSFGGRLLCEGVQWAARTPELMWDVETEREHPFNVDTLLVYQMAAPADCFQNGFPQLVGEKGVKDAPLRGPIVLTHTLHDRALGHWHRRAEGSAAVGYAGAGPTPIPSRNIRLLQEDEPYTRERLDNVNLINVDASWRYKKGKLNPAGAHSDFCYAESAHLMLSLATLSRPDESVETG
jgi:hypothetical protein